MTTLQKLICTELEQDGARGATMESLARQLRSRGYLSSRSPQIEQKNLNTFIKALNFLSKERRIRIEFRNNCCGQIIMVLIAVP